MLRSCLPFGLLLVGGLAAQKALPSPETTFGHAIGADGKLVTYAELEAYWQDLAEQSPRMELQDIGPTAYSQTQRLAVISSPTNLARREELRAISERLARGADVDEAVAGELTESGRAVVWIDGGMHATETLAAQQLLELVWQLVGRDDEEVTRILDEVVVLVCPSNPDGMEMVTRAYRTTGRVGGLPVLYQKYCGHDNNRDYYAGNTVESRNIARVLYHQWFPQVVYNHHQSAPRGTILFTPPFRDPFNYQFDPLVVRGTQLVAAHMNHRFALEGKRGIISRSGARYSTWWNGGLRTTAYFHNMIGILTEAFGRPDPVEVTQRLDRRLPNGDHPDPLPSQTWHARQTIEYQQTANFAVLDYAARYRRELLWGMWRMARSSIERAEGDHWTATPRLVAIAREREQGGADDETIDAFADPALRDARVYVLPADQPDFSGAVRLVRALRRAGIEVGRTTAAFESAGGRRVPAGSLVIDAAQAFRPHLRDMLEPQWHPGDRDGGDPVRPYDAAGWTLSMQMDCEVLRFAEPPAIATEPIAEIEIPFAGGAVRDAAAGWWIDPRQCNWPIVTIRLLAAGVGVGRLSEPSAVGDSKLPAGAIWVPASEKARGLVTALADELGTEFNGLETTPDVDPIRTPRLGLFEPWGGDMETGWTSFVLDSFEVPYAPVFGARLEAGELRSDYDVLIVHGGMPPATKRAQRDDALRRARRSPIDDETLEQLRGGLPPFEDWSTLEERAIRPTVDGSIPALREFVEAGGRLLVFGDQVERIVRHLELPVAVGVRVPDEDAEQGDRPARRDEFFVPASLLWADVDVDDPLCYGLSLRQAVVFRRGPVLAVEDGADLRVPVRYLPDDELLASGWAVGGEHLRGTPAVVRVPLGQGEVVLFGMDAIYRGQPTGTFKMVFNAILSVSE